MNDVELPKPKNSAKSCQQQWPKLLFLVWSMACIYLLNKDSSQEDFIQKFETEQKFNFDSLNQ